MNQHYHYRPRKARRKKRRILPYLIILTVLISGISYWKYRSLIYSPVDIDDSMQVSFLIKNGESVKEIASKLKEKDLIKNETAFYFYVRQKEMGENMVAGRFLISRNMNVPELLEALSNPSNSEAIITIQEGLTIRDIDQKLADQELIDQGEFITAVNNFDNWSDYDFLSFENQKDLIYKLEGYIYPDTYFVDPFEFKPEQLITLGLDNFEKKFKELDNNTNYSDFEIITMASIIENEVFGKKDRKLVSGLLWKRLENGWTLGADITLLYLKNDRSITYEDIQDDNPYNTRKNLGLPPGPVSNPSIESIEASLNPTESDYWFYLTTLDTGEVIYSRSNEEHNMNKNKYL